MPFIFTAPIKEERFYFSKSFSSLESAKKAGEAWQMEKEKEVADTLKREKQMRATRAKMGIQDSEGVQTFYIDATPPVGIIKLPSLPFEYSTWRTENTVNGIVSLEIAVQFMQTHFNKKDSSTASGKHYVLVGEEEIGTPLPQGYFSLSPIPFPEEKAKSDALKQMIASAPEYGAKIKLQELRMSVEDYEKWYKEQKPKQGLFVSAASLHEFEILNSNLYSTPVTNSSEEFAREEHKDVLFSDITVPDKEPESSLELSSTTFQGRNKNTLWGSSSSSSSSSSSPTAPSSSSSEVSTPSSETPGPF